MFTYITSPSDVLYCTGKSIDEVGEIEVLRSPSQIYCFCDTRNEEELRLQCPTMHIVARDEEKKNIIQKITRLTINPATFTKAQEKKLSGRNNTIQFEAVKSPFPIDVRQQKTEKELQKLAQVQRRNAEVIAMVPSLLRPGITETELAQAIKMQHLAKGADVTSFCIVAFGEGTTEPHHTNRKERSLRSSDHILIDTGCSLDGYQSDMTRCFFPDKTKNTEAQDVYTLLQKIVADITAVGKIGMQAKDVYFAAKEQLGPRGEYFTHGLGHGIGLDVHEVPYLKETSDDIIIENMVFSLEPGVYIPAKGRGVRFENLVVAQKDGWKDIREME